MVLFRKVSVFFIIVIILPVFDHRIFGVAPSAKTTEIVKEKAEIQTVVHPENVMEERNSQNDKSEKFGLTQDFNV